MTVASLPPFRKMVGDSSNPKLLVAYFLGFLPVVFILTLAIANNDFENVATMSTTQQEDRLFAAFIGVAYLWGVGIPLLTYGAIASALTLAREAEQGTLGMLLTNPVKRREVLFASFGAVVVVMGLVAAASLLLTGLFLYVQSGVTAAALRAGVFAALPGALAAGMLFSVFVASLGTLLAVLTRDRLRTAVGVLSVPALFLAFMIFRLFASEIYTEYGLYVVDINHHFGSAYIYLMEAAGNTLDTQAQQELSIWTGAYEFRGPASEEVTGSFDLIGFDPVVSVVLLVGATVAMFGLALYRFERLDVS